MGSRVVLTLKSKRAVRVPGAYLYNPTGSLWPSCSLLFTTFSRLNEPATDAEMKGLPTWYFGRGYEGRVGKLSIPSKSLGEWTRVGEAIEIEYTRGGYRAPGRFFHPFGKRSIHTLFRKMDLPVLYRQPGAYRLELGSGCRVDDRGIVKP